MEKIVITAILKPKEGFEQQLLSELKKVYVKSRQESGCVQYILHQSVEDQGFVLYEVWENQAALDHHTESAHYQEYRKNIAGIATREVYKLKLIEP